MTEFEIAVFVCVCLKGAAADKEGDGAHLVAQAKKSSPYHGLWDRQYREFLAGMMRLNLVFRDPIYLFNHVFISVWPPGCFILRIIIQYFIIDYVAQTILLWPFSYLGWLLCLYLGFFFFLKQQLY